MTTPPASHLVYLTCFVNMKSGHHAIYVDTEERVAGHYFHVVGSLQRGMTFEAKEGPHPVLRATA
ncbi:hypothetical protein G647_10216 [Cladophialophora carrionii CBS 160.54]|uniref:Uncharacterized protein n=1 Tax=Cladophialophora carrionii CBS 160.54 TaxID=1279043 RepID=V9DJ72_9EURO|nr:uncharacterized protein G647_10216 [Cladophialophora carrionii CBS 160.54]ETI26771.1 hypothetical protein G647_10216 [Cladophialophora carrionii CBS 160.54]